MLKTRGMIAGCLLLSGCLSIPDDIRADLTPPDRKRPNNYGMFVEGTPGKWQVQPDTPTIAPVDTQVKGS